MIVFNFGGIPWPPVLVVMEDIMIGLRLYSQQIAPKIVVAQVEDVSNDLEEKSRVWPGFR